MLVPVSLAFGQVSPGPSKIEFDAASIRVNPQQAGFHFASNAASGGPGTPDPGLFRCTSCTLAALIGKAFDLPNYRFPGRLSLGDGTFDVMAKIPPGATPDDFLAMLRNLLTDRFSLAYHFEDKTLRGYYLTLARGGSKLKESGGVADRGPREREDRAHNGLAIMYGSATYRGDHRSTADLARLLSDHLSLPVEDHTGLRGAYDISLTWSGNVAHTGNHAEGAWSAGAAHGDHGGYQGSGAPAGSAGAAGDSSGPTLFDAVQSQLGLKLVPAEQAAVRVFVVDRVERLPTAN